jgi:adenylyl- and sulfurtransferase ThiI
MIKEDLKNDESFIVEYEDLIVKNFPTRRFEYHLIYNIKNELGERIKKTLKKEFKL